MAPTRASTPPPSRSSKFGHPPVGPASSTTGTRQNAFNGTSNVIMGSGHTIVPPSPGVPLSGFQALTMSAAPKRDPPSRRNKNQAKDNVRTGAGVKKQVKKKSDGTMAKVVDAALNERIGTSGQALQKPFRFMDLPGELRNEVYMHTHGRPKQALLVYRPRIASLRPRTRLDRGRTLASDLASQEQDEEISSADNKSGRPSKSKAKTELRETNRPFWGLTQVCRQLRIEYRPIYMAKQEIGMDLTEMVDYLQTFYPTAADVVSQLAPPGERQNDAPFVGNLTIAVGDKANDLERAVDGIEVFPLLDIWSNSLKIEAGFGRYLKANYVPETDGEAKDLYRLFGRRVLKNRSCSGMNNLWRSILRSRSLASVRIHRKPAPNAAASAPAMAVVGTQLLVPAAAKPYVHIVFKADAAEPWMTEFESVVPKTPNNWLAERGFGAMEYFEVKVGVEQDASN
ncbi:hypothetical protein G6011_07124 [Alternaria panax]|uniref:Uncharacterized protein n=1 Tax=Alternaria panax TaxID=48097 RepID=A0AAD4FBL0_9PLEO|nr:hypothetical protein G6011_07124 [Alternaria panax]